MFEVNESANFQQVVGLKVRKFKARVMLIIFLKVYFVNFYDPLGGLNR